MVRRIAEAGHTGRSGGGGTGDGVLDHKAFFGRYTLGRGGSKKKVRCWFAATNVAM